MNFININNITDTSKVLADKIGYFLAQNKKILWLLSGGSNVHISVGTLNILKVNYSDLLKSNLMVMLMDERYGLVGHDDSNWQQLIKAGFDISSVHAVPVLVNVDRVLTTKLFADNYTKLKEESDLIIGQFGIGIDGHTAGVLPNTCGVNSVDVSCTYNGEGFERITLTLNELKNIDMAITFAFGESKKEIIKLLQNQDIPFKDMPAQVLKQIPESYLYSD